MTTMLERAARAAAEKMRQQDQDAAIKSGCDIHLALDPYLEPARDIARAVLMAVRMENGSDVAPLMGLEDSIEMDFLASDFTSVIDAILESK